MFNCRCWSLILLTSLSLGCGSKPADNAPNEQAKPVPVVRPEVAKPSGDNTPKTGAESPVGVKPAVEVPKPTPPVTPPREKFDAVAKYEKWYSEAKALKAESPEIDRAMKRIAREAATDGASEYIRKCIEGMSAMEQDNCAEQCIDIMIGLGFDADARKVLNHIDNNQRRTMAEEKITKAGKPVPGLLRALKAKDARAALIMIDRGTPPDVRGPDEETALMYAAEFGFVEVARALIQNGADVKAKRKLGASALLIAASQDQKGVAELLLDSGADIEARNDDGLTPLHAAAAAGKVGVAKLLLDRKADVNARNNVDATPLHVSMLSSGAEMSKLLLDRGAEINAKTNTVDKFTPLGAAVRAKNYDALALLLHRNVIIDSEATQYARYNGYDDISRLLRETEERRNKEKLTGEKDKDKNDK